MFGHGEGGMASLSAVLTWERVEFGGVVCVGGKLHAHAALPREAKSKTPVLLIGGALGITNPVELNRVEQNFFYVDCDLMKGKDDTLPSDTDRRLKAVRDFFAHRLRVEEWAKPAIITFGETVWHPNRAGLTRML